MTFAELTHHHFLWRRTLDSRPGAAAGPDDAQQRYEDALARFEAEHGEIVAAYWCLDVESAVALTVLPGDGPLIGRLRSRTRFHRVSDWATHDQPEVAHLLHE